MTISNVGSKTSDRIEVILDADATANLALAGVSALGVITMLSRRRKTSKEGCLSIWINDIQ